MKRTVSGILIGFLLLSVFSVFSQQTKAVDPFLVGRWSFDRAREWSDFAYVDGDSAELVIGLSDAQLDAYAELSRIVTVNGGKIVNDVSIEESARAVVADIPFDLVPSVVYKTKAAGLAKYVEPNFKFQAQFVPNDPYWSWQWGPKKIEADWAWNTTVGDPSILAAVIDTGIDYNHPDLAANYVTVGYDWVNNDTDPMDDNSHGTHVAGTISAVIDNALGVAGVANLSIMAEKGLDAFGSGWSFDLADAIIHAVDKGANIISMSWGGYDDSELIHDAIKYAYNSGVLLVGAAGNDATSSKHYPAAYEEVIAVAATDQYDDPAWFTNYGNWVELAAPGVDIYSTVPGGYTYKSGTSMATPHVSGVAALIWSQFPYLTRDQVRARLQYTADDLGDPGFDDYYGYGRINARKAVEWHPPYHDLSVSWEVSTELIEPRKSTILNATVHNVGLSNETNVELYLLINGTVVRNVTIAELLMGASFTVSYLWTPTEPGEFNITAYAPPVPNEEYILTNIATRSAYVQFYTRTYLPNAWIGGGTPMSWHGDDASWTYPLPFNFPFYGNNYSSIYISSNGLITFLNPDSSYGSSISALAGKLAIAPAWDDWVTYDPYDIYMWQGSNRVSIRWYVRAYGSSTEANFEAILTADGEIQFNYQYNDGPVSTTIGISNGVGDILAEDATTLSYINTIKFIPWSLALSVHNINSGLDYSTIQGAIDAQETSDGHTIFAETGTYYENVVVNKAIALVGEDHETTIIDGNYMGTVIRVTADDVTIMNFTVRNSGVFPDIGIKIENSNTTISGNIVTSNCFGIYIHPGLDHNKITGNTVRNSGHSGISLEASSYNLISGNHIEDSYYYGIFLGWSSNFNNVSENEITDNGLGIYLCYSSPTFNRIIDNNITDNDRGISLFDASNNTVSGNNIANNTFGFFLAGRLTGSLNNSIYHNNIANNTHQVHDESWVDPEQFPSINVWDDGYPSGGNYWSDYVGVDLYNGPYQNETGSDKIGDTPYYVPTGSQDRYPLMNPYANTTVSLEPVQMSVSFGQIFAVDVHVSNVVDLYAYEFKLTWNYSVVELQSAVRPSGHFLEPQIDPGNQFVPVWKINESRSGDLQTAHFGYTLLAPEPAKTGSGILVTLTFRALAVGSTLLDLKNTMLANDVSAPIMHSHLDSLVTVNPPPSVAISPDSVVMDVGQSQLFTSSVSGGTSPFAYQWFLNDAPVSGATSATWAFTPSSTGFYNVYVNVTDGVSFVAKSNSATVTVNPPVSVTISPTSVVMTVGQSQLFTSSVANGTPPYTYQWHLDDTPVSGATSPTWTFTPTTNGTYHVYLGVTDSVSGTAQSDAALVTVVSGVHDIALTGITNSKSGCRPFPTIGQNDTCQINITVSNLGDYSESFNVTVYVNSIEIQRIAVIDLAPLTARVLTVNWSTIGFAKGNYTISALAEPVIGETNTTNNSVIGETVVVVMQGDINGDGIVDIFDIVRVALSFGMTYPNPSWDPNADINNDGTVDIFDLVVVALHFGETG